MMKKMFLMVMIMVTMMVGTANAAVTVEEKNIPVPVKTVTKTNKVFVYNGTPTTINSINYLYSLATVGDYQEFVYKELEANRYYTVVFENEKSAKVFESVLPNRQKGLMSNCNSFKLHQFKDLRQILIDKGFSEQSVVMLVEIRDMRTKTLWGQLLSRFSSEEANKKWGEATI